MQTFPYILVRNGGLPFTSVPPGDPDLAEQLLAYTKAINELQEAKRSLQAKFDAILAALPEGAADRTIVYNQRKRLFQGKEVQWRNFGVEMGAKFVEDEQIINQAEQILQVAQVHLHNAYQSAFTQAIAHLELRAQDAAFQIALVASASDLFQELGSDKLKSAKIQKALYRYITRAATKTSPLSHLGTVQYMHPDKDEEPVFEALVQRFSPNVQLRPLFYALLEANPDFVMSLHYVLNPSLTHDAAQQKLLWLRYQNEVEEFMVAHPNEHLTLLFDHFKTAKPMPLSQIQASFGVEMDADDALEMLLELVQLGFLTAVWPESGMDASWSRQLMQNLAFLGTKAPEPIIDALNILSKSGNSLAYMHAADLQLAEQNVKSHVAHQMSFAGVSNLNLDAVPCFYHDVQKDIPMDFAPKEVNDLARTIANELSDLPGVPLSARHSTMLACYKKRFAGQLVPFLLFAHDFHKDSLAGEIAQSSGGFGGPIRAKRVSALVQPFRSDGQLRAVLNGLGSGGGRLYGRFLPMLPSRLADALRVWNESPEPDVITAAMRWVGASNANFHALLAQNWIDWPGLGLAPAAQGIKIHDIGVRVDTSGLHLELVQISSGKKLDILEFGLESRHEKPMFVQYFLDIAMPSWGKGLLLGERQGIEIELPHVQKARFIDRRLSKDGNIVLSRKSLIITFSGTLMDMNALDFYRYWQEVQALCRMPTDLFYQMQNGSSKPQFLRCNDTLSVEVFRHFVRKNAEKQVIIEEMWPDHGHLIAGGGTYVSECVLEIML